MTNQVAGTLVHATSGSELSRVRTDICRLRILPTVPPQHCQVRRIFRAQNSYDEPLDISFPDVRRHYRHFSNQARFWLLCSARRCSFRQRTKLPVRKSFLYTKRPVESRAIIFPRNRRRQFHQLALGKIPLQRRKQFIRNFRRRAGERGGKSHYILFRFREIRAGFELIKSSAP
jgi:hypothetical protein